MRAISKEYKKLEATIIATDNMINGLEEEEISDVESDDDSINTKDELDGADDRATERYLFQQASSNASVTTLDTRNGSSKPNHNDDSKYHEIALSPTKKHKEHHSESEDEDENSEVDNMDTDDNNDETGVDSIDQSKQHRPMSPGPPEDSGALPSTTHIPQYKLPLNAGVLYC